MTKRWREIDRDFTTSRNIIRRRKLNRVRHSDILSEITRGLHYSDRIHTNGRFGHISEDYIP